jgi:site-specific DNA recombinase
MRCLIYLRVSTAEQAERDLTEEGFSIPAQRGACLRHIREQGWQLVDEYTDRGESARSVDRPQLQAMLGRVIEQRDVDAVVVHKVDRLARNIEDHVAIRAALRRCNVTLVSVSEKLEETASGRLVEGIHALMAEFYSANLAAEVKKGMVQKAKMGGYPQQAPIGYRNVREAVGHRSVARIVPDPERAPMVKLAFELYATGEFTQEHLLEELRSRGLTNRAGRPITLTGVEWLLSNKLYMGVVSWNGIEAPGLHEPLVPPELFNRVQDVLAVRGAKGTRERRHRHHLKGILVCGVCGRRLCLQFSKGRYLYFFCLGMKDRKNPTGCRERFVPADVLERQVEEFYERIQLPAEWVQRLHEEMHAETIALQGRNSAERTSIVTQLQRVETERRKLLDAYYAGAVDVVTLRTEQERISREARRLQERLASVDASLEEWQEVLGMAIRFASDCAAAYRRADDRIRTQFNAAVFEALLIRDGRVAEARYRAPFDLLFAMPRFEYQCLVEPGGLEPPTPCMPCRCSPVMVIA